MLSWVLSKATMMHYSLRLQGITQSQCEGVEEARMLHDDSPLLYICYSMTWQLNSAGDGYMRCVC